MNYKVYGNKAINLDQIMHAEFIPCDPNGSAFEKARLRFWPVGGGHDIITLEPLERSRG